ncbi:hypothetical protein ETE50_22515 [Escherichia coli]|nr:hypothetical protein ETE50_22515 [Escherichia coli]QAV02517.1 hypothetical protein ETE55_20535 [Escherichia coli]QAV03489.1 hypothetical protein ETE55_24980 [Escherichia coli]
MAPPCRRRRPGGPPSRVAGNGLSGKRNDRFAAPADPAPWPRHAAGGGLAAPRHGLPETDLVESGMTGSWRW